MRSLKNRLFKGAAWNALNQLFTQIINMGVTLYLANRLFPENFGILGNIMILFFVAQILFDLGLTGAMLSIKNIYKEHYNNAFWLLLFGSISTYLIIYFISPLLSIYYEDGDFITFGVRLVFSSFLLYPLYIISMVHEFKALKYDKITITNLISIIVSSLFALLLIKFGYSKYSLIAQFFVKNLLDFIIMILFIKWFPNKLPDFIEMFKLLKLGFGYLMHNAINYFSQNIDFFLVGRLLGNNIMGLYTISFRIAKYPLVKFFEIIGKMLFPAFVELKNENITKVFFKITAVGSYFLVPVILALYFTIEYISIILLKPEWNPIINIIKIILFYSIFDALSLPDKELLKANNKVMNLNYYRIGTLAIFLVFGIFAIKKFGILGIAHVYGACQLLNIIIVRAYIHKIFYISLHESIYYMRKIILEIILLFTLGYLAKLLLNYFQLSPYFNFSIFIVFYFFIFLLLTLFNSVIDFKTKRILWDNFI